LQELFALIQPTEIKEKPSLKNSCRHSCLFYNDPLVKNAIESVFRARARARLFLANVKIFCNWIRKDGHGHEKALSPA
jgi:hypothetical protein